jgi:hypothetical protein
VPFVPILFDGDRHSDLQRDHVRTFSQRRAHMTTSGLNRGSAAFHAANIREAFEAEEWKVSVLARADLRYPMAVLVATPWRDLECLASHTNVASLGLRAEGDYDQS